MQSKPMPAYHKTEEEEKKLILREYRALMNALKSNQRKSMKPLLRSAFEMAVEAHKHMRRKSGEPYILHPLAVARIVVEEVGLGYTSAICALLHDTVEDTEISLEDIEKAFNPQIAKIIDGLTKISNATDLQGDTTLQAENFKKILLTIVDDPRVILIKLADRLHNMRTLESMSREKQLKIASETSYIYSPLAHRLGLYQIKSELEDLSMKYTNTEMYVQIAQNLNATKKERAKYIADFIQPIEALLKQNGINAKVYGRPKSIHSIWNKMKTKNVQFSEVYDLFAIRIIINTAYEHEKSECWKAYSLITDIYKPSTERLRDWISSPKGNGYEALHNTVMGADGKWVEIQIRSARMDEIAEKGLAAHWKYKADTNNTESKLDKFLQHLSDILTNNDSETLDFIQDFKLDLFSEEIYIYTPKGQMMVLPKGASVLDFAFDIHTELGMKCIGAKVNYKLMPLNHILKSGDQVEIITSNKQKPSEEWLNFLITAKAKSKVKTYLKEAKKKTIEEGKEMLKKKLAHLKTSMSHYNLNEICAHFKLNSHAMLYHDIAVGNIDINEIDNFGISGNKIISFHKEQQPDIKAPTDNAKPTKTGKEEVVIFSESSDKIKYKLAQCCQPIPGDNVFGFVTNNDNLTIHRTDCPNAARLLANFGHRIVKTKWAKNKEISFLAGVRIVGIDDIGVIQKITNVISGEQKLNMRSLSIESDNGIFEGTIMVFVHDKEEFNRLCNKIATLDGIKEIERLNNNKN